MSEKKFKIVVPHEHAYLDKSPNLKVIAFAEYQEGKHKVKIPVVEDQAPLQWAKRQKNLITCPICGESVFISYEQTGYDAENNIPIGKHVYSPVVIEKKENHWCRVCKHDLIIGKNSSICKSRRQPKAQA